MNTAEKILKYAEAALVLALMIAVLWIIPNQIQSAANAVRADAKAEAAETRTAVVDLLEPLTTGAAKLPEITDRHLGAIEGMTKQTLAHGLDIIDKRTEAAVKALDKTAGIRDDLKPIFTETAATIAAVRPVLNETTTTIAAARPAFVNGGLMFAEVHAALTPMLDCKGNAACLPSETTGILGGTKTLLGESALTMREWRKVTPKIAGNVAGITGNAEKISHPHWYTKAVTIIAPIAAAVIAAKMAK